MREIRVLVICGTGIATSTIAAMKIKNEFQDRQIPFNLKQGEINNLRSEVSSYKPDLIVSMTVISDDFGIPIISGVPLLTRMGIENFWNDVFAVVGKIKNEKK